MQRCHSGQLRSIHPVPSTLAPATMSSRRRRKLGATNSSIVAFARPIVAGRPPDNSYSVI